MGGVFGDKEATLDRFRENYAKLSQSVKNRLVLENDDVSWTVHDLLPICHELNIPLVLDYHHHNIMFDSSKLREGTLDIMNLYDEITSTWKRKGITQKMHYSEPTPAAITGRQRRKHSPRVATLPPCANDMDLMIEAKDKEQAVFELMRTFKLPGYNLFNDIIPHVRHDENKPVKVAKSKSTPKKKNNAAAAEDDVGLDTVPVAVPDEEVGMGGPERRVYWPPTMEEWLRPPKRIVKKKEDAETPAKKRKKQGEGSLEQENGAVNVMDDNATSATPIKTPSTTKKPRSGKKTPAKVLKVQSPENESEEDMSEDFDAKDVQTLKKRAANSAAAPKNTRKSGRASKASVSYAEEPDESD
jgi:UV DNA damage endonuclease